MPLFAARRFSSIFSHITESLVYNISIYIDMVPPNLWRPVERLIHCQFSSQLCMLFMSLRISKGTFTLQFYCIFVFLSDILERLIRCSQLFVIRLWYVILWYTFNTGLVLGCTSVINYSLSEYGQKPLTSSDESDDFLWF